MLYFTSKNKTPANSYWRETIGYNVVLKRWYKLIKDVSRPFSYQQVTKIYLRQGGYSNLISSTSNQVLGIDIRSVSPYRTKERRSNKLFLLMHLGRNFLVGSPLTTVRWVLIKGVRLHSQACPNYQKI